MANSAVPSKQWVKTGLDFVKDGLWGRLGVQENFGSTWIAGAINGLAVHENAQNGKTLFYAGSVNGGVYLRTYDRQTDQWDESWQPLSRPGSGYEGSQSITQLGACRTLHRGPVTVLEPWDSEISDRSCGELSQLLRPLLRLPGTASTGCAWWPSAPIPRSPSPALAIGTDPDLGHP